MKGSRIIIPKKIQHDILEKIHEGHLGINKCRARARQSVWWPGVSKDIEDLVKGCVKCATESQNPHEPLKPAEYPKRPWQKLGMDLFYQDKKWYLLVMDYYSRYPEIVKFNSMREDEIILQLKSILARHGTPEMLYSDNGTHFGPTIGSNFQKFAMEWGFTHVTSSPKYSQSNGFAEAGVKIMKKTLKKRADAYTALESYRATPLANGYSPAELLMGRRIRTSVPMKSSFLVPKTPDAGKLKTKEEVSRMTQKENYDRRHRVRDLSELKAGDKVWIVDLRRKGTVKAKAKRPRSYVVKTDKREIQRNRFHLIPLRTGGDSDEDSDCEIEFPEDTEERAGVKRRTEVPMEVTPNAPEGPRRGDPLVQIGQQTKSGRVVRRPGRLIETC